MKSQIVIHTDLENRTFWCCWNAICSVGTGCYALQTLWWHTLLPYWHPHVTTISMSFLPFTACALYRTVRILSVKQFTAIKSALCWPSVTETVLLCSCRVARQHPRYYHNQGGRLCAVWNTWSGWRHGQLRKPWLRWSQLLPQVGTHFPSSRTTSVHFWTTGATVEPGWGPHWSFLLQHVQWDVSDAERAVPAYTPAS